jgi:hypothetical protein
VEVNDERGKNCSGRYPEERSDEGSQPSRAQYPTRTKEAELARLGSIEEDEILRFAQDYVKSGCHDRCTPNGLRLLRNIKIQIIEGKSLRLRRPALAGQP